MCVCVQAVSTPSLLSCLGCVSELSPAQNTSIWSPLSPSISHNPPAHKEWDMRWNPGEPVSSGYISDSHFCTPILSLALFFLNSPLWCRKIEAETVKMPLNAFPSAFHCQIFLQAAGMWVRLTEGERCLRLIGVWRAEELSTSLASSLPKTYNCKPFCGLCFTLTHPQCCALTGRVSLLLHFRCLLRLSRFISLSAHDGFISVTVKQESNYNKEFNGNYKETIRSCI